VSQANSGTLFLVHSPPGGAKEANDRDGVGLGAENQECGIGCGDRRALDGIVSSKGKVCLDYETISGWGCIYGTGGKG
jgi:hypothetical protein